MKLVKFELLKLFNKRLFIICLLLFMVFNTVVLYYSQSSDLEIGILHKYSDDYERTIDEISDLSSEDAKSVLHSKLRVVEIAIQLDSLAENEDEQHLEYVESMLVEYQQESPKEYEQAQELDLTRQELLDRRTYLSELVSQSNYADTYDTFIGEMKQRADNQKKFSIFAKKGSFAYNNIEKTPTDFENLKGVKPQVGNNSVLENATTFVLTDFLVFALVFLMCIYIFTYERDKELYGLIRTNKNGRLPLIASKLTVLVLTVFAVSIVYYLSDIIVSGMYTGFGDMSRCIQSSSMFMNCNMDLSIWQYLVIWCLSKAVTMCVVAVLLALIFVLIKNTATIVIVTVSLVLFEGVLYSVMESNSPLNMLKYINFFYFVGGNNVFGNYLNVNFFSKPVNLMSIYLVLMPLLFEIFVAVTCTLFAKKNQFSSGSILAVLFEKLRVKFSQVKGSTKVFSGECFKHYKGSMAILAILLLIFVAYTNLTDDISLVYISGQDSAYNVYMTELEGELTKEKEEFLQEQQAYFDGLYEQLNEISMDTTLSPEEKTAQQSMINSILQTKGAAFNDIMQQMSYIKGVGQKYNITPQFINKYVYKNLVENPSKEWQYFTLLLAMIIFVASNAFAYEHKKQMANLIRCTKIGKFRLVVNKIAVATLTTIISYVLIYLPYYINFIRTFGTTSFDSPLIFMQSFSEINSTITINQMVFLTSAVHIVFALMALMLVVMLSQITKSNILCIIVSSVILLVPCLLCQNAITVRLFTTFQNGMWLWFVPTLIVFSIVLILLFFAITSISFCRVNIASVRRKKNANS